MCLLIIVVMFELFTQFLILLIIVVEISFPLDLWRKHPVMLLILLLFLFLMLPTNRFHWSNSFADWRWAKLSQKFIVVFVSTIKFQQSVLIPSHIISFILCIRKPPFIDSTVEVKLKTIICHFLLYCGVKMTISMTLILDLTLFQLKYVYQAILLFLPENSYHILHSFVLSFILWLLKSIMSNFSMILQSLLCDHFNAYSHLQFWCIPSCIFDVILISKLS